MKNIDDYLLTNEVTVGELKKWMNNKDDDSKTKIINLIQHRFYNRYIKHLKKIDSGFLNIKRYEMIFIEWHSLIGINSIVL